MQQNWWLRKNITKAPGLQISLSQYINKSTAQEFIHLYIRAEFNTVYF